MDATFDLRAVMAGGVALGVAVVTAVVLVFLLSRANALLTHRMDVEALLREGHVAMAISSGAVLVCQALLVRHAVFPVMAGVRDLLLSRWSATAALSGAVRAALIVTVIATVSYASVALASLLFTRMTGRLDEMGEIRRNNVAVAIFHAFVLLAITAVLNEGIEDLARSLVPYGRTGIVTIE